ncbi:MAG TPA: hypothetical protein VGH28_16540 [Polyangiaceae bacterium]
MRSAFAFAVFVIACLPPPPSHVAAHPPAGRDVYSYSWNVPASAQPAKELTIAVVRPDWARDSSVSAQTHKAFAAGFSSSLAVDLDKILVAKGIKVSGPFPTYDDITYSDKKSADLVLTPTVFLTMSDVKFGAPALVGSGGVADYVERKFSMTLQGFVEFVLVESLSRQKLWVKKLDLDPQQVEGVQAFTATTVTDPTTSQPTRVDIGPPLYRGMEEAIGDAMMRWYPTIAQKAWTYLDTDEMTTLKPQVNEIRERSGALIR